MSKKQWSPIKNWFMTILSSILVLVFAKFVLEKIGNNDNSRPNPKVTASVGNSDDSPLAPKVAKIRCSVYQQDIGEIEETSPSNGESKWIGVKGRKKRIEGFKLEVEGIPNSEIRYQAHIADNQWSNWKGGGEWVGRIRGKAVESIRIEFIGKAAKKIRRQVLCPCEGKGRHWPIL